MRGPFARFRQERADDRELGTGLWRRAHDRLSRALDRYWQVLEGQRGTDVLSPEERNGVVHAGNVLTERLPAVRALCARLHRDHEGDGEHIPAEAADVHRELSRAAHELAATAQALALYRLGQGSAESVGRHAERTLGHLDRAEELGAGL